MIHLILWRTADQGQLPWCVTECLLRKLVGARRCLWRVHSEPVESKARPLQRLSPGFSWAGLARPAVPVCPGRMAGAALPC